MQLPGIVTAKPGDADYVNHLARMAGESFLEEMWTRELLSGVTDDETRKLELSCELLRQEMLAGAPFQACYGLKDARAAAIGYLRSDLGSTTWQEIEDHADEAFARSFLTPAERDAYERQLERMAAISVFDWEEEASGGSDFIHFPCLAVSAQHRGTGTFRRLMTPFFEYADAHGIPCFLETYTSQLEGLYGHFGFETVRIFEDPAFAIAERCMVRKPQASH